MSREKANDPSPQSSFLVMLLPFWSSLSSYVGLLPYYGGSFTRSLMLPVGNTVHRRHQRVALLRVGF
jgi:hypothetical protein